MLVHMNYSTSSQKAAASIRALLAERGDTIIGLSEVTGIPISTLNRRMNGLSPFTVDELEVIAGHLKVSTAALLTPPSTRYAAA